MLSRKIYTEQDIIPYSLFLSRLVWLKKYNNIFYFLLLGSLLELARATVALPPVIGSS